MFHNKINNPPSIKKIVWNAAISIGKIPDAKDAAALEKIYEAQLAKNSSSENQAGTIKSQLDMSLATLKTQQDDIKKIADTINGLQGDAKEKAEASLADSIGVVIWDAVMTRKKLPDAKEAAALQQVILTFGPKDIIEPIVKNCLGALVALRARIEDIASDLQTKLPLSEKELKEESKKLHTETANAIHRQWQADYKQTEEKKQAKAKQSQADFKETEIKRFKPCFKEKIDEATGREILEKEYKKLERKEPFDKFYSFATGVWNENIYELNNSQLQPKNTGENNVAADIAMSLLTDFLPGREKEKVSSDHITEWLLETAGPQTHVEWLKRNKDWATDTQRKSFEDLPALQAIRDFQVLTPLVMLSKNQDLVKQPDQSQSLQGASLNKAGH